MSATLSEHTAGPALGLGTVQFGTAYGVSNRRGKASEVEVRGIIECAAAGGVDLLDTAPEYGDSEAVLGRVLRPRHRFRIISKIPRVASAAVGTEDARRAVGQVAITMERLRRDRVDGVLIHHVADLLKPGGERLVAMLNEERAKERLGAIGVSVYDAAQIDAVLDIFRPDIVQLPANVLDRRLVRSGHIAALAAAGIEVHVRSVFLQGLLLMDPADLPPHLSEAVPHLVSFREAAAAAHSSPLAAALAFARGLPGVSTVLVGVTARDELEAILTAWRTQAELHRLELPGPPPAETLLDPRRWRASKVA